MSVSSFPLDSAAERTHSCQRPRAFAWLRVTIAFLEVGRSHITGSVNFVLVPRSNAEPRRIRLRSLVCRILSGKRHKQKLTQCPHRATRPSSSSFVIQKTSQFYFGCLHDFTRCPLLDTSLQMFVSHSAHFYLHSNSRLKAL